MVKNNSCNPPEGINIWDGVLTFKEQVQIVDMVKNSSFFLGWGDSSPTGNEEDYLHSKWTVDELKASGFLESDNIIGIMKDMTLKVDKISRVVVNLDTTSETHWAHIHPDNAVLLYYVNTEWLTGWGGETLFFSKDNKYIEFGAIYEPNRVIVFDGEVPHSIRPPSRVFPHKYRYTLAILFDNGEQNG
jgi:hypothetical protein